MKISRITDVEESDLEDLDRFHGQDRKGGRVKKKDVFNAILSRILQQTVLMFYNLLLNMA